jgi:4-hydroxy-tetrahydrodipicolinate synthase
MNKDGSVDYDTFLKLLKAQESAQNGIVVLGSTGEALNLDESERRAIVELTFKHQWRVPIMVGVGGVNLHSTVEWVRWLEKFPAQALLLVTPLYAKPGAAGQTHWFESLMNATSKPCMLYNVPGRSAVALNHKSVRQLQAHKNCWSIKEASGSTAEFRQYVEDMKGKPVYSGDDALMPDFAPLKAKGLVSVASNVWPQETHRYVELCLNGQLKSNEAQLWRDCSNALFVASNPVPVKVLMSHLKHIATPVLRSPLDDRDIEDKMPAVLSAHERIGAWWQQQNKR